VSDEPQLPSIRRARLVDEAAAALRAAISRGDFAPGQHLFQEQLSERLGVSRTPLREALRKLEEEGLVVLSRGRGVEVRTLDLWEAVELYEVREMLDGLAARLCAQRSSPEERAALRAVHRDMQRGLAAWDPHDWLLHNLAFHEGVVRAARNRALSQSLNLVRISAQTFYPTILLQPDRARVAWEEHGAVLRAIEAGDPQMAEAAARRHIVAARLLLEERIQAN
jgi:DNA-binding GntR family transcriptional regulator